MVKQFWKGVIKIGNGGLDCVASFGYIIRRGGAWPCLVCMKHHFPLLLIGGGGVGHVRW
jgi:hypothetical protein